MPNVNAPANPPFAKAKLTPAISINAPKIATKLPGISKKSSTTAKRPKKINEMINIQLIMIKLKVKS